MAGKAKSMVLRIEGMTCNHCVRAVTKALMGVEGVSDAQVVLAENIATITYEHDPPDQHALEAAVEEEGYKLEGGAEL
jgi:copper chaperone CopZ